MAQLHHFGRYGIVTKVNKTQERALDRAIQACGGVSAMASALGVGSSTPSMWKLRGNVPAEYYPVIERLTQGSVRCEELRADVEWSVLRETA